MSLKTKMTALFTASALALGTFGISASPAAALGKKDRQALSIILGIGAAALILDSANNDRRSVRRAPPRKVYRETRRVDRHNVRRFERRIERREHERDRNRWERNNRRARIELPAQCVTKVRTRHGWREVVSSSCLDRRSTYIGRR